MNVHDFDLRMVAFNDIRPDATNIRTRRDPDDDLALKQSILINGLIEPFIVCEDGKQGYLIVDGHRTHDACREIFDESNPDVPCIVISQEAGKQFNEGQLRKIRLLKELHTKKLDEWDRIVGLKLYTDEMREMFPDMDDKDIAKTLGKSKSWLSKRLTIHGSGTFAIPVSHGKLSSRKVEVLKGAPQEAQEPLIYATEGIPLDMVAEIVKLVKGGTDIPLAIESVITLEEPSEDDPLSLAIDSIPEDLRERFTKDTKDFNPHDIKRIVKLIENGVVMHDAIRTVKLSQSTETPQEEEGEDALSSSETELTVEDKAAEVASPVVDSETVGEEGHSPQQDAAPLTSSSTPADGIVAQTLGLDREAEPEEVETPAISKSKDEPPLETEKPKVEEKKKEPQVCVKVGQWEDELQKLVKKPPKTFLATFKTKCHKGNFKNRMDGIHLWSGELLDRMDSDLNGDSLFICEVNRKRNALMDLLKRPKHSIVESEKERFGDLMNELKTKIEQDAKRGG